MNIRTAAVVAALAALQAASMAALDEDEPALFEAGTLLVADAAGLSAYAPDGSALPQPLTGLSGAAGLCFAPDGTLFVSDAGADAVLRCDAEASVLQTLGEDTALDEPAGLALGPGGALFVASRGTDSILVFDADGEPAGEFGADAGLLQPWGLAFDASGRLHAASSGGGEVLVFDPGGALLDAFGGGELSDPRGLCFGRDGKLYVASRGAGTVVVFSPAGDALDAFDGGGLLDAPTGLAFGPDGLLYVAAGGTGTVYVLEDDGTLLGALLHEPALQGAGGLAFAPDVFTASLKGSLQRAGESSLKFKAAGRLVLRPGALPASLRLDDPLGDAAELLGAVALLHGWHTAPGTAWRFDGEEAGAAASQLGLSALHLDLKATARDGPAGGATFEVKKASGPLHHAGPDGVIDALLRSGAAED